MESLETREFSIGYTLKSMGYSEKDDAYQYVIKAKDILLHSKANYKDRVRILRYLQHICHHLKGPPMKEEVKEESKYIDTNVNYELVNALKNRIYELDFFINETNKLLTLLEKYNINGIVSYSYVYITYCALRKEKDSLEDILGDK